MRASHVAAIGAVAIAATVGYTECSESEAETGGKFHTIPDDGKAVVNTALAEAAVDVATCVARYNPEIASGNEAIGMNLATRDGLYTGVVTPVDHRGHALAILDLHKNTAVLDMGLDGQVNSFQNGLTRETGIIDSVSPMQAEYASAIQSIAEMCAKPQRPYTPRKVHPSVVHIESSTSEGVGTCAGVIVGTKEHPLVLTAAHCTTEDVSLDIAEGFALSMTLPVEHVQVSWPLQTDGAMQGVHVTTGLMLYMDEESDIAVVALPANAPGVEPLRVAAQITEEDLQGIYTMWGHPYYAAWQSQVNKVEGDRFGGQEYIAVHPEDSTVWGQGNSGGPLLSEAGAVAGVFTNMRFGEEGVVEHLHAVPSVYFIEMLTALEQAPVTTIIGDYLQSMVPVERCTVTPFVALLTPDGPLYGLEQAECVTEKAPQAPNTKMKISETTDATFEQEVIAASHEKPVLVEFFADWCEPCKDMGASMNIVAPHYNGRVKVMKFNVDPEYTRTMNMGGKAPQTVERLGVQNMPTIVLFHKGGIVSVREGALNAAELAIFLEDFLPQEAR